MESNSPSDRKSPRGTAKRQQAEAIVEAMARLASKKLSDRLGAIHALGHIAGISKDDRGPIMDVLAAFVRDHAPLKPKRIKKPMKTSRKHRAAPPSGDQKTPQSDVQAALTAIAAREVGADEDRYDEDGARLDLRDAALAGANLAGAELVRVDLAGADLRRADLTGAYLRFANLAGANLHGAILAGADLIRARLADADLSDAKLIGANLMNADLARANLRVANLTDANLPDANLAGAVLRFADLTRTNLVDADLTGADLYGAILWKADLTQALLTGADLTEAWELTQAQLDRAFADAQPKLDAGLKPPPESRYPYDD